MMWWLLFYVAIAGLMLRVHYLAKKSDAITELHEHQLEAEYWSEIV